MNDTKGDSIRAIVEQLRKAHEGKDPNEHVGIRRWEFGRLADRIEAASERIREQCAEIETIKIMMRKGIRERADAESKHKAGMEMNERLHVRMRALKRELDLRRAASGACRHGGDAGQGGRKPPVQRHVEAAMMEMWLSAEDAAVVRVLGEDFSGHRIVVTGNGWRIKINQALRSAPGTLFVRELEKRVEQHRRAYGPSNPVETWEDE